MAANLALCLAVVVACAGLAVSGVTANRVQTPAASTFHVIGYYPDWTAARYPIAGIPAAKLTHVNYAFGKIGPDSRLTFATGPAIETVYPDDCREPSCRHGLFNQITLLKARHPHLKFLISVGGWTDSGPFYEMAAAEASRRAFAESCAEFLRLYPQFDGIDIDWEHPVIGGLERGQPRDAHNYVLMLEALRRAIGPAKLLTAAVSASPRGIQPLEYVEMATLLDWVSPMAYDFHSGNSTRAGYNAALYNNNDPQNAKLNLHDTVQAMLAKGVPASKLVAGLAFFGKGWTGVASADPWGAATATAAGGGYATIAERYLSAPGYVRYWDDVAKVPRLYNAETTHWISYDDPQSVRLKGEYVAQQKLAGAMFWELSGDNGALVEALRAGLGMP